MEEVALSASVHDLPVLAAPVSTEEGDWSLSGSTRESASRRQRQCRFLHPKPILLFVWVGTWESDSPVSIYQAAKAHPQAQIWNLTMLAEQTFAMC